MAFLLFGPFDQRCLGMRIGDCESRVGFAARASRPPEFRGRGLYCSVRCCLTIVSEERETWAAVSLRGLEAWVGMARVVSIWVAGSEEMLTVTFQNSSRLGRRVLWGTS